MKNSKKVFLWLQVLWFLLWAAVLIIMLLPKSQRDTPIFAFTLYPIMYGIEGHLLLLFIQFLYHTSNRVALRFTSVHTDTGWPWQATIALIIFSISAFNMLISLPLLFTGTAKVGMPAFMLPMNILSLIALYGLIIRTRISYRLIQGYCYLLLASFLWILSFFIYDGHSSIDTLVKLIVLLGLYAFYVYSISTSNNVKRFFGLL